MFLVRSLGGVAYVRRRKSGWTSSGARERTPGPPSLGRIHRWIFDSLTGFKPFRLQRKRALYERDGGGRPMRFIDAIEPAGEAETVCIQVAAADSLYVTDDFLLTHNTLNDSFVILDEAQNTSPEQMKMFLTRLGFNSRMVVTGDVTQIDLPTDQRSGLIAVRDILSDVQDISFVRFGGEDVVRHKLVQRIVAAYDAHASARRAPNTGRRRVRDGRPGRRAH